MPETMKRHVTDMGYSVVLTEEDDGGYLVSAGGRPLRQKTGKPKTYRGIESALARFYTTVGEVEGWEAKLAAKGLRHPIVLCAGGCGLEMRVTEKRFPDGRIVTVEEQMDEKRWCVSCGFKRHMERRGEPCSS